MKTLAAAASLLILALAVDAYYDCRRKGITCVRGACSTLTGDCICPSGISGSDCGLNDTLKNPNVCTTPCANNGTCYVDSSVGKCYCPEKYTGDTCGDKRAEVICNGENMTITIRPYTGFMGIVYIKGAGVACDLVEKIGSSGEKYFTKVYDLDTGCSASVQKDKPNAGDTTFIRDVIIQYNPNIETSLDQVVTTSCTHKDANVTSLESDMKSVVVDQRGNLTRDKIDTTYEPVKLEIQERNGQPLQIPVYVGKKLRLYLYLTDKKVYESLKVEVCYAKNGLQGASAQNTTLVENSCPHDDAKQIIRGDLERDNATKAVIINFDAFKFRTVTKVVFDCKVRVCKSGDNRCDPEMCDGSNVGFGRKKRDTVSPSGQEELFVQKSLDVLSPSGDNMEKGPTTHPKDCLQMTEIITVIVVLGVAVILLLLITLLLALRILRSRSRSQAKESEIQSVTSSDSSTLRIPRVREVF